MKAVKTAVFCAFLAAMLIPAGCDSSSSNGAASDYSALYKVWKYSNDTYVDEGTTQSENYPFTDSTGTYDWYYQISSASCHSYARYSASAAGSLYTAGTVYDEGAIAVSAVTATTFTVTADGDSQVRSYVIDGTTMTVTFTDDIGNPETIVLTLASDTEIANPQPDPEDKI